MCGIRIGNLVGTSFATCSRACYRIARAPEQLQLPAVKATNDHYACCMRKQVAAILIRSCVYASRLSIRLAISSISVFGAESRSMIGRPTCWSRW